MEGTGLTRAANIHSVTDKSDGEEDYAPTNERLLFAGKNLWKPWQHARARVKASLFRLWGVLGTLGGFDWYCFGALGILTALMSFLMDLSVAKLLEAHRWLYVQLQGHLLLQFLCWSLYPTILCALSTTFSHSISPNSAGSGLPEVRTILSGLELPEYLTLSNLFAKLVGLTCTLAAGSVVFLGKVGPFVHLSTMVGAFLDRLSITFHGKKEFRARNRMLIASAAVAVASCFGAPVSGVLFSMEVMSVHFTVHDYCRCFLSAAFGALTFRLLAVWSREQETIQALFKTSFSTDLPYHPPEILVFILLGLLCGVWTCVFLYCHRWSLLFIRTNQAISKILATEKAAYSAMVAFLLALVTFPHGLGRFMASTLSMKQLLASFLHSQQWKPALQNVSVPLPPGAPESMWLEWSPSGTSVLFTLVVFLGMKLWLLVLAMTLPLPLGFFMPIFIYGAAIGRLVGEGLAYMFPNGIESGEIVRPINPGGYALAGAAAFSGAMTHTLSPALLVLEMTGQSTHAAPTLLAVLLANAVARSGRRPSLYDNVSLMKKLPHLPSLLRTQPDLSFIQLWQVWNSGEEAHDGRGGAAEMVLERDSGPAEVRQALSSSSEAQFPVVESYESAVLLGSVHRSELEKFLYSQTDESSGLELDILGQSLGNVCSIQPVTVQLSTQTTVQQAHSVMSILNIQLGFVTDSGKLSGVITWTELKKMIERLAKGEIKQNNG
ncbi:chloride channel K [Brienomyrus brachyistius]|uniref:chloride channel K n=1 Tax=Brienomyrus brachyistius TaxID=42636 RepID=UPI0020B1F311|nr:chloride channel K [Brienomyrus brachyistius]